MSTTSPKKPKLVRDSFTIPKAEYAAIDALKTRAIGLGTSVKKSELLRAGLMLLQALNDAGFKSALSAVPTLKTGRPLSAVKPAKAKDTAPKAKSATPAKKAAPVAKKVAQTPAPARKPTVTATKAATRKPAAKPVTPPAAKRAAAKSPAKPAVKPASAKPAAEASATA